MSPLVLDQLCMHLKGDTHHGEQDREVVEGGENLPDHRLQL